MVIDHRDDSSKWSSTLSNTVSMAEPDPRRSEHEDKTPQDEPLYAQLAPAPPTLARSATADITNTDVELARIESRKPVHSVFSRRTKWFIVFMAAWGGLFSPLSANIYLPALNVLSEQLNVTSSTINLTLTTYMIFQGLAPTFFGDFADQAGRRPAYIICFIIYIGANIGLALQKDFAALIVLRCLQSSGSSSTIALASGVVADIATAAERGTWMGLAQAGALLGPAIGPILGGILAQFLGWQAIFWFLTILAGVYLAVFVIAFPETGRKIVGDGSVPPPRLNWSLPNYLAHRRLFKEEVAQDVGDTDLNRIPTRESVRDAMERKKKELANNRKLSWPNPLKTLNRQMPIPARTILAPRRTASLTL